MREPQNNSIQRTSLRAAADAERKAPLGNYMIQWIIDNKEWLFSGIGLLVLSSGWYMLGFGYSRWKERYDVSIMLHPEIANLEVKYESVGSRSPLSRLPAFLVRLLVRPDKVASKVRLALRGEKPIALSLNSEVPRLDLYFEITNLSPLDLVLDRLLIDMWFGQPTFNHTLLRRYVIPSSKITKDVYFRHELTTSQRHQIEEFVARERHRGSIHIYLTAYFESKAGRVVVEERIERRSL